MLLCGKVQLWTPATIVSSSVSDASCHETNNDNDETRRDDYRRDLNVDDVDGKVCIIIYAH